MAVTIGIISFVAANLFALPQTNDRRLLGYSSVAQVGLMLTVVGLQTGFLLAGDFLAETIFNWPGIGRYGVTAITNMDFPAIMGITLLSTLVFLLMNLFVDILYVQLDPRIRYE